MENVRRATFHGLLGITSARTPRRRSIARRTIIACLRKVYPHASYVAVNISSPNTRDFATAAGGELDHCVER